MKNTILALLMIVGAQARAEDRVCTLKGMVCKGCVEIVTEKICGPAFSTCEVSVGKAHLVTRVRTQKIDVAKLNKLLGPTAYSVVDCVAP